MRGSPRRAISTLLCIATLITVSACDDISTKGQAANPPFPSNAYDKLHDGTLYLLVGDPGSGNLWQIDISTHIARKVTNNRSSYGVSWISASPAGVVMADASKGVDELATLQAGVVKTLPEGHVFTPAISQDGNIAYIQIPDTVNHIGPDTWRLTLRPTSGHSDQILYQQAAPELGSLAWGANGQVATVSAPGHTYGKNTPELLVIDPTGKIAHRLRPDIGDLGIIAWTANAPGIAVTGIAGTSEIITIDGKETKLPNGWAPGCWSPDGTALLVIRNKELGLWHSATPTQVDDLGAMSAGTVQQCSWLSKAAAGTSGP
jgi:hypothetical protein